MSSLPVSLLIELDHAQHRSQDEEHQDRVQQDVLGQGDAASVCQRGPRNTRRRTPIKTQMYQLPSDTESRILLSPTILENLSPSFYEENNGSILGD